jgi:hypothetical protein
MMMSETIVMCGADRSSEPGHPAQGPSLAASRRLLTPMTLSRQHRLWTVVKPIDARIRSASCASCFAAVATLREVTTSTTEPPAVPVLSEIPQATGTAAGGSALLETDSKVPAAPSALRMAMTGLGALHPAA